MECGVFGIMAGLQAARAKGRKGGRRPQLTEDQAKLAANRSKHMHADDITQVHRTDRLEDRLERIEHRLDIHDHEH
jgi:ubiquinone biosynthesis protein UbiJ